MVIGHEITHGFDDKGRLFDKNGNLHRWWNEEVIKNFHGRAECLIGKGSYTKWTFTFQTSNFRLKIYLAHPENVASCGTGEKYECGLNVII